MPSTPLITPTSTAALLLDVLECVSVGAVTADEIARQVAGGRRRGRALRRRVDSALEVLAVEGLVASRFERGALVHVCTAAGTGALEQRGRLASTGTVLFTDLVGSTELIERFGEAGAHERRLRHFDLLRGALASHGGREIKNLGDGLMVLFAEPAAAMRAAAEMQKAVAGDEDRLGLRVGIHTGELLREDGDVHGSTVVIAARLCNRADGGQIIASDETRAQAGGGWTGPVASLGQLALKGLAQPVAASSVRWAQRSAASGSAPALAMAA